MNLAPTFLDRVRLDSPATADELRLMHDAISTGWNIEHNPDGTHQTIQASGTISERNRKVPMGVTVPIFFDANNFSGSPAVWTVAPSNVLTLCYALVGTRMILDVCIQNTTVSGAGSNLFVMRLPDGWYAVSRHVSFCFIQDNGTPTTGLMFTSAHSPFLTFARVDLSNFTNSAANTALQGQIACEVGTS